MPPIALSIFHWEVYTSPVLATAAASIERPSSYAAKPQDRHMNIGAQGAFGTAHYIIVR